MIKIGVTGGIGAGKTLLCKIFEVFGYPTFYADEQAKYLMQNNTELKNQIKQLLGSKAYDNEGHYDRTFVASKVFNNKKLLSELNDLVHPAVHKHADLWFSKLRTKLAFYEAALIVESNNVRRFEELICVTAPIQIRVERVMNRSGLSEEQILGRISNQSSDQEKRKHASYEVINDGTHSLINQAIIFHQFILS